MSFINSADDNKRYRYIPYLTQEEYNLIQFCVGDMMRQFDKKKQALGSLGFNRTHMVTLLRKMGVTSDLSENAMITHRDMTGFRDILLSKCRDCNHNRTEHAVSDKVQRLDPSLSNAMSFIEESGNTRCLMPMCPCRRFVKK